MNIKYINRAICACLLSITVAQTHAAELYIYTYTGNNFTTFSSPSAYDQTMNVTMTFVFESPQDFGSNMDSLISFGISDGINTLTQNNASLLTPYSYIHAFNDGVVDSWRIRAESHPDIISNGEIGISIASQHFSLMTSDTVRFLECESVGGCYISDPGNERGYVSNDPGLWVYDTVPVPPAVWLFGSGLIGLIGVVRRKVRV
jgi:hypothetical protein